jgi:hypothetical protein
MPREFHLILCTLYIHLVPNMAPVSLVPRNEATGIARYLWPAQARMSILDAKNSDSNESKVRLNPMGVPYDRPVNYSAVGVTLSVEL